MTELLFKLFAKIKGREISRHEYGLAAGVVGIICNVLLSAFKIVTGLMTGAVSIASDAVNNMSDAVSSVVTLVGFKISGKPADREHPYGHGRAEYITGFVVSAAVIAVAINLFKESVTDIFNPKDLDVSITTMIILVVSILLKLWMSFFYSKVASKISSEAMRATAVDSRADCITTAVALISVTVMLIWKVNIDGYAGAVVSLLVIVSGFKSAKETIEPLLGGPIGKERQKKIEDVALSHNEIMGVHDMRVHEYGHDVIVASMHVEMPYNITLVRAHEIVDDIERKLVEERLVSEVTIHVDPVMTDDHEMLKIKAGLTEFVQKEDSRINIYDFRMIRMKRKIQLIFDILVPYDIDKSDEDIRKLVEEYFKDSGRNYEFIIEVDRE